LNNDEKQVGRAARGRARTRDPGRGPMGDEDCEGKMYSRDSRKVPSGNPAAVRPRQRHNHTGSVFAGCLHCLLHCVPAWTQGVLHCSNIAAVADKDMTRTEGQGREQGWRGERGKDWAPIVRCNLLWPLAGYFYYLVRPDAIAPAGPRMASLPRGQ